MRIEPETFDLLETSSVPPPTLIIALTSIANDGMMQVAIVLRVYLLILYFTAVAVIRRNDIAYPMYISCASVGFAQYR